MDITSLSSKDLKKIATLVEKKESLQSLIDEINSQISSIHGSEAGAPRAVSKPQPVERAGKKGKRSPRGSVKETLIRLLSGAGKDGVSVKELAKTTGMKPGSIHSWIYVTGKKARQLKKVSEGRYRWDA